MAIKVEVYEWPAGEARPGEEGNKHRNSCLYALELPDGNIPQAGDVLTVMITSDPDLVRWVVIEREFFFSKDAAKLYTVWLLVRQMENHSAPASAVPR